MFHKALTVAFMTLWSLASMGAEKAPKVAEATVADFSRPAPDPAAVERGKQVFSVNCGFCHGSGARGGEGGPNLLRSPIVLNDQNGEIILAIVQVGRPDKGMPKFNLGADAVSDIAAYLHSLPVGSPHAEVDPQSIIVGNPKAGEKYFYGKGGCDRCHSLKAGGDLAGIGSKYDPKTLQDNIVSGGAVTMLGAPSPTAPARTAKVTRPNGEVISGTLVSVDDFNVTLIDAAGARRSVRRAPGVLVEVKDPMQAHLDMLREWEDRDIHDLSAFLVKQK